MHEFYAIFAAVAFRLKKFLQLEDKIFIFNL